MIGTRIRELREKNNILLRQLAAQLEMDTAMLSKMERGDRFFKKENILALAKIFNLDSKELLILWLGDKIVNTIKEDEYQVEAVEFALNVLKHR